MYFLSIIGQLMFNYYDTIVGKLAYCKQILEKADSGLINKVDNQNRTALHLATTCGHGDIVHLLLTHNGELIKFLAYLFLSFLYLVE